MELTLFECLVFGSVPVALIIGFAVFATMPMISNMSPYYDYGDGLKRLADMLFAKDEPETPKALKPLINASTNRDFVIEMLKLRKETLKKYGYDPFCSLETPEEIVAAERVAAALECLVNKYPDPDDFNKALTRTGLTNYITKINNKKEN